MPDASSVYGRIFLGAKAVQGAIPGLAKLAVLFVGGVKNALLPQNILHRANEMGKHFERIGG